MRPNISLGDTLAGLHAALGIAMALLHRQTHNKQVPGQVGCLECKIQDLGLQGLSPSWLVRKPCRWQSVNASAV